MERTVLKEETIIVIMIWRRYQRGGKLGQQIQRRGEGEIGEGG